MAKPKQTAVAKDILINQGADYRLQFRLCTGTASNYTPIDITGYTFECKIKETADSDTTMATAECNIIDALNGLMEVHFDDTVTDQIETDGEKYSDTSEYVWDVYANAPDGEATRFVNGTCYISPGVSFD